MKHIAIHILFFGFALLVVFTVRGQDIISSEKSSKMFDESQPKSSSSNRVTDSLKVLNLPSKMDSLVQLHQSHKIDSISGLWKIKIRNLDNVLDTLETKIISKNIALQQVIHKKTSFTDSLTLKLNNPVSDKGLNYTTADDVHMAIKSNAKLPDSNINTTQLGNVLSKDVSGIGSATQDLSTPSSELPGELKNINAEASKLGQLPRNKISKLSADTGLGEAKGEMQKVSAVTGKVETYNKDLKSIASGNPDKVKALPKDIENAAMNQGEMRELTNEVKQAETAKNVLTQYQNAAAKMNEEGGIKKVLKDVAAKQLPDYFSGQEEKLQAGVAKFEKLKRKYGSIPDSRYLPKHAPSDMKGKPLIERIVPGINFQFFQMSDLTITDLSPFTMYRFTSRLRTGLGYTYRLQFNSKVQPIHIHDAFGYRIMTDYKIISGFHAHAECEWMKMVPYDPSANLLFNDSEKKQWIPGLYLGILKQYKAGRYVNGNFQVMYNFLYHHNGLYPNKINIRFGFEFPLKKKNKI